MPLEIMDNTFLVTEIQDKIRQTLLFLQEEGHIEKELTLKEIYNKYLHPSVLPKEDKKIWEAIQNVSVLDLFQFDTSVGSQAAKKVQPTNLVELSDANGLMRLMTSEKGEELPLDRYVRFKKDISLWYKEMDRYGLTKEEQKVLEPYYLQSYGTPPSQEQLMKYLMDEKICGFSLADANKARKIIAKKEMSKIPELKEKILNSASSVNLGKYIWEKGATFQLGYAFSQIHSLAYSFIGAQTAYLATHWNPIYWNTACLVVNSGSLEEEGNEDVKEKGTDYKKVAKAIGDIRGQGISVSLVDINHSDYGFKPDEENNTILYGLKGLSNIGQEVIDKIIEGRPYKSFKDFMQRCPLNKTQMISLIKAGAFDKLEEEWAKEVNKDPRILIMTYYLSIACEPKKKLTLQNFNGLIQRDLVPESLLFEKRVFLFNKHLKAHCKSGMYYLLDTACETFYNQFFDINKVSIVNGLTCILQSDWDKIYKKVMDNARDWLKGSQDFVLKELNTKLFLEAWNKYAQGTISAWEMESLCFYYHEHELINADVEQYGIVDFNQLSPESDIEYFFKRNGKEIPIYKTYKIIGTVISKDDIRSSVALLTTTGVVNVKFTKEYYAMFNRQISETQEDGTRKIKEKGWFTRGTKIMCNGYRRDDQFVCKTYKHNNTHQLYRIIDISDDGELTLEHNRYGMDDAA